MLINHMRVHSGTNMTLDTGHKSLDHSLDQLTAGTITQVQAITTILIRAEGGELPPKGVSGREMGVGEGTIVVIQVAVSTIGTKL